MSSISNLSRLFQPSSGDDGGGNKKGLINWILSVLYIPVSIILRVAQLIKEILDAFFAVFYLIFSNLHWVLLFGVIFIMGSVWFANLNPILTQGEHFWRCRVYEMWDDPLEDMARLARDVYNKVVCWTNALGFIYRLFGTKVFVETLRECPNGFDFFNWVRLVATIITQFISDALRWAFTTNSINSAFPAYNTIHPILMEWLPSTVDGMICLCADLGIFVSWIGKLFQSLPLVCILHQLANIALGGIQVAVQFILDLIGLMLAILFGGGSGEDTKDVLTGVVSGDTVIPSLSNASLKERAGAAAVYIGVFLNDLFQKSLCYFRALLDSNGDGDAVDGLYDACMLDPDTRYNLFCIIGPIVAGYLRLYSLIPAFIFNIPVILQQIITQPPGDRYLTDVWWDVKWDYFFDTIRIPRITYNYTISLNFPIPIPGGNVSSIKYPNVDLYGPDMNVSCTNLDNDRETVPCIECNKVAEEDGETCVCKTALDLDRLTEPFLGIKFWDPWVCCLISRVIRVGVAFARLVVGAVTHVFNFDRFLPFLVDQNHYDVIFDELVGQPYVVGGVLECIREILLGFDDRLRCLADIFIKPIKAVAEFFRIIVIAVIRFLHDILGTGEPGFFDYMCITDPLNCVEVERTLSHWRRPRENAGFDPLFQYHPPRVDLEPAFIDCLCQMLNFEFLVQFLDDPPDVLPDFCCGLENFFRFIIECFKLSGEIFLALFETVATVFVSGKPINYVVLEYLACTDVNTCSNIGDIVSDLEDFLNCPCAFIFTLDDIISDPPETEFFCICDFITGVARAIIFTSRATVLFSSCILNIIYCIPTGWDLPDCGDELHARLTKGFEYVYDALDSITTILGSIGCLLGLPFVGFGIDCLGTTFTWPEDHKPCQTSATGYGVCSASDRFFAVGQKLGELIIFLIKFAVERLNDLVDLAWGIILSGDPDITGTISDILERLLLGIGEPLWGISGKILDAPFGETYYDWPNQEGVNQPKANDELEIFNDSAYVRDGWTYDPPASGVVYNKTFSFTNNTNVTETTGLMQATGLLVNCLLGPPGGGCVGPELFEASVILGDTGCIGDILVAVGNVLRDIWSKLVTVFVAGVEVLTSLFGEPANLGTALIKFFRGILELLIVVVGSAEVLVDAVLGLIVETARFFFGDGVAEMFRFFLTVVSEVIDLFIMIVEDLIEPYLLKRNTEKPKREFFSKTTDQLYQAYKAGYTKYYTVVQEKEEKQENNITESHGSNHSDDADHGRKRQEQQPGEPDYTVLWERKMADDFGDDEIDEMTEGTFCKKVMKQLKDNERFTGMKLAQEALWKTCFMLYSIPNEVYGITGGGLNLPDDIFYNTDTFFPILKSLLSGVSEVMEWRLQRGGSMGMPITSYTDLIDVPKAVMDMAELQLQKHRDVVEVALSDVEQPSSKRRHSSSSSSGQAFFPDPQGDPWNEKLCTLRGESLLCADDYSFIKGYTVYLGESGGATNPPSPPHGKAQRRKKRGFTSSQSGAEYASPFHAAGNRSPFVHTGIVIYNSLRGDFLLNITSIGKLFPVINGKIAYTFNNITLASLLYRKGLKTDLNDYVIKGFESFETKDVKTSYLRFDSNIYHLSDYLTGTTQGGDYDEREVYEYYRKAFNGTDHTSTKRSQQQQQQQQQQPKETDKKGFSLLDRGLSMINKFLYTKVIDSRKRAFSKNKKEEEETTQRRQQDRDSFYKNMYRKGKNGPFADTADGIRRILDSLMGYSGSLLVNRLNGGKRIRKEDITKGYKKFGSLLNRGKENYYNHRVNFERIPKHYVFGGSGWKRNHRYHAGDTARERKRRQAKVDEVKRKVKKQGMLFHHLTEVIPSTIGHITKSIRGFFNYQITILNDHYHHQQQHGASKRDELNTNTTWQMAFESNDTGDLYGNLRWMNEEIIDDQGQIYGKDDVVYVMSDAYGSLRTYDTIELSHVGTPSESKGGDGGVVYHPIMSANYYEVNYMTQRKRRRCLNDKIWFETIKSPLPASPTTNGEEDHVMVKVQQCYRITHRLQPKRHPHQKAYGHILKGQSLYAHRMDMVTRAMGNVYANLTNRLSQENIMRRFREVYVRPYIEKHKDTFIKHNRTPALYKLVISYEEVRKVTLETIFGTDTGSFTLPNIIKAGLGHPVQMAELGFDEEWRNAEIDRLVYGLFKKQPTKPADDSKKRAHRPPLLNICLPQASGDNITSCSKCTGCATEQCSICSRCENCTLVSGSTYGCEECGSCRVEGPYCKGECYNCTDCTNEPKCLDCALVLRLLSYIVDYVNFCVRKTIFNDTSVIIKPRPGIPLVKLIPYENGFGFYANDTSSAGIVDGSCALPYITVNTNGTVIGVFNDLILGVLSTIVGFDVERTAIDFFQNTNVDPFNDSVGLFYFALRKLVGRCNRDIDTQCTFGLGFEKGLIYASIITLCLTVFIWFICPPLGGIFGNLITAIGLSLFYWTMVASIAWFWNPACLSAPAFVFFDIFFNTGIPPPPILPECAADEIYTFLNNTLQRCLGFIPESITTDGNTCPETCDEYINFVNFTGLGFTNAYTILGYAGQRFIPEPLNFWFNDYLETTCLVQGGCSFGMMGAANTGPLYPFFEVDFSEGIANQTATFDDSFFFTFPGIVGLIWPTFVVVVLLYLGIKIGVALLNFAIFILKDTPLKQLFPWARPSPNNT